MEDAYQKYRFSAISIKKEVAARFREFSRLVSDSHTSTLETVMNFFEWNDLSPNDDLGIKNNRTNKRINAVIAILKNIEKYQTLPTKALLDTLFQEMSQEEGREEKEENDFDFGTPKLITENEELIFYRKQYEQMREEHMNLRTEMTKLFNKINVEKQSFGKNYLKINLTKNDFDNFRKSYNV